MCMGNLKIEQRGMKLIDLAEVKRHHYFRANINQAKLEDMEFVFNGKIVKATEEEIEDFRNTGLSNMDFAFMALDRAEDR